MGGCGHRCNTTTTGKVSRTQWYSTTRHVSTDGNDVIARCLTFWRQSWCSASRGNYFETFRWSVMEDVLGTPASSVLVNSFNIGTRTHWKVHWTTIKSLYMINGTLYDVSFAQSYIYMYAHIWDPSPFSPTSINTIIIITTSGTSTDDYGW